MDLLENGSSELRPFLEFKVEQSIEHGYINGQLFPSRIRIRGKRMNEKQLNEVRAYIFEKLDEPELESCRYSAVWIVKKSLRQKPFGVTHPNKATLK
ncbi:MAG: hypothetical protein EOP45_13540 [Sphingobacteriaceae bacterium]|nr:MAG: hypothetical protein EOP45_13540 [Sphingobacteriaceae bacterium]